METIKEEPENGNSVIFSRIRSFFTPDNLTSYKIVAFFVIYLSYAVFFACGMRQILPKINGKLHQAWMYNSTTRIGNYEPDPPLFAVDTNADKFMYNLRETTFMSANAVGIILCGFLGDRFEPRKLICLSAAICSISLFLLGPIAESAQLYNQAFYIIFVFIFGIFQAFAVPITIKLIFNWRRQTFIGIAVGFMAVSQQTGVLITRGVVHFCLSFGYEYVFLVLASFIIALIPVVYFGLVSSPNNLRFYEELTNLLRRKMSRKKSLKRWDSDWSVTSENPPIGLKEALMLKNVIAYCLCNFFMNMINFSLFYFDPAVFIWGTEIVGGLVGGALSDKFGRNSVISIGMLASLFVLLVGVAPRLQDDSPSKAATAILAVLVKGTDFLIEAAVAIDIAAKQHTRAVSTLTGLIAGSGAIGLTIGRIITPIISEKYGWQSDFYLYMLLNFIAICCIGQLLYREFQKVLRMSMKYRYVMIGINNRLNAPNFRESHSVSILYGYNYNNEFD